MALIKTFESFMDDRERLREETRERESSIISTFSDEQIDNVKLDILPDEIVSADDTLSVGREIAEIFPVDLIETPVIAEEPMNINDEFPVDLIDQIPEEEFSTEDEINQEFPVDLVGFEKY